MSLTANFYAGENDKLFTTFVSGGSHTGTVSNGSRVQVNQDEATPGTRDVALIGYDMGASTAPHWRSPGSMALPCLDYDGASSHYMRAFNNAGTTAKTIDDLFSTGSGTLIFSIRVQATATNDGTIFNNTGIFSDDSGYIGVFLKTITGTTYIYAQLWDGSAKVTTGIAVSLDTDYVCQMRWDGSTLYMSVLSGSGGATRVDESIACGSIADVTKPVKFGANYNRTAYYGGCIGQAYCDDSNLGSTNTPLSDMVTAWLPVASDTGTSQSFYSPFVFSKRNRIIGY